MAADKDRMWNARRASELKSYMKGVYGGWAMPLRRYCDAYDYFSKGRNDYTTRYFDWYGARILNCRQVEEMDVLVEQSISYFEVHDPYKD